MAKRRKTARKKAKKKAVKKKRKKATKRRKPILRRTIQPPVQLPELNQYKVRQPNPVLLTISGLLMALAIVALVVGIFSDVYKWWIGLFIALVIWLISRSMKHW